MNVSIAVIGGGVVGTSIAYHLAVLGEQGVALFERATIGSGTTSRAVSDRAVN
jgi:sarcosine oxidase subunit beta